MKNTTVPRIRLTIEKSRRRIVQRWFVRGTWIHNGKKAVRSSEMYSRRAAAANLVEALEALPHVSPETIQGHINDYEEQCALMSSRETPSLDLAEYLAAKLNGTL